MAIRVFFCIDLIEFIVKVMGVNIMFIQVSRSCYVFHRLYAFILLLLLMITTLVENVGKNTTCEIEDTAGIL